MTRKIHTKQKRRMGMRGHHQSGAKVIRRMKKKTIQRLLREQKKMQQQAPATKASSIV